MSLYIILLILAGLCAVWAVASAVLLTVALDQRGLKTPFPFLGAFLFRNLCRYREITLKESGKVGPLYYSYVIPINLAVLLILAALAVRVFG